MSALWLPLVAATLQGATALVPGPTVLSGPGLFACLDAIEPADPSPLAVELASIAPDPAPPKLTNDRHYLTSNELRLDIFEEEIRDRGGVFLGVGAGQNYLLAGWARPELMMLVDFDQDVVDLHGVYALFFAYAATPEQFAALWTEEGRKTALSVIELGEFSTTRRARLTALYKRARHYVEKWHDNMKKRLEAHDTRWILDDPEQYDHVAELFRRGQVIAHRGDFTKPGVMLGIGEALTNAGADLGVLYLSNIEMYFMYGKAYKANMAALPLAADTVVLRTLPAVPAGWEYIVQAGDNFDRWVSHKQTWSVYTIRGRENRNLIANNKHHVEDDPPRIRKRKAEEATAAGAP
jgi:hypothetical protein